MADYSDYYDFSDYDPGRGPRRHRIELDDVTEEEYENAKTEGSDDAKPENTISDYEKGRRDGYAQGREEAIAETLLTIIKAVYNGGK